MLNGFESMVLSMKRAKNTPLPSQPPYPNLNLAAIVLLSQQTQKLKSSWPTSGARGEFLEDAEAEEESKWL
jgi:hypothetical protein